MITKEEFEKAIEVCTNTDKTCAQCPLSKKIFTCGGYLTRYIKENEPAPSANGTSSVFPLNSVDNTTISNDSTPPTDCQEVILHKVYSRLIDAYDNDIRSDLGIRYLGEALGMLEALGYGES